jgi:CheY-like chemotaxis protein
MPIILVVDSDVPALGVLGTLLTRQGWQVVHAASARDAVAIARHVRIDSVLTAMTLLDGTGDGLQEMFRTDPSLYQVPFFFMTGCQSDLTDMSRARGLVGPVPSTSMVNLLTMGAGRHIAPAWIFALHRAPRN